MEATMKPIHKTSAISFYLINSGFKAFKNRIREELSAICSTPLESLVDDSSLQVYYRSGISDRQKPSFLGNFLLSVISEM